MVLLGRNFMLIVKIDIGAVTSQPLFVLEFFFFRNEVKLCLQTVLKSISALVKAVMVM